MKINYFIELNYINDSNKLKYVFICSTLLSKNPSNETSPSLGPRHQFQGISRPLIPITKQMKVYLICLFAHFICLIELKLINQIPGHWFEYRGDLDWVAAFFLLHDLNTITEVNRCLSKVSRGRANTLANPQVDLGHANTFHLAVLLVDIFTFI